MNDEYKKFFDLSYKLLDQFKTTAPGTFMHCQNVSLLCEGIGKEVGLDSEKLKLAGLYHDIGKMWFPQYFSENIVDKNPHDLLDPITSYHILTRHVSDSVNILLNEPDFPRDVIEIISKHHGDMILQAIYIKYKEMNPAALNCDHLFRYKTHKPDCLYSTILMIVDSVEAAAKSKYNDNKLNSHDDRLNLIEMMIEKMGTNLDNLTRGMERTIKNKLIRELDSIYHPRVSYETLPKNEEVEKNNES